MTNACNKVLLYIIRCSCNNCYFHFHCHSNYIKTGCCLNIKTIIRIDHSTNVFTLVLNIELYRKCRIKFYTDIINEFILIINIILSSWHWYEYFCFYFILLKSIIVLFVRFQDKNVWYNNINYFDHKLPFRFHARR